MQAREFRIPQLCTPGSILLLVLVGAMLAVGYALVSASSPSSFWLEFGLSLLFIEWIVILSAGLICLLRRVTSARPDSRFVYLVVGVIPLLTLLASWLVVGTSAQPAASSTGWFIARNVLISLLASLMLVRYLVLQHQWRRQVAAEARARLDALQASIRPHFLFNALNTIASLVHGKPDQAEQATLDLSDLLRTGLKSGARHSLAEELELIRGYLRLEALRLGERLEVDWGLADDLPLEQELPALLIQPLVENAVVHGIARLPEGGRLSIRAQRASRKRLRFVIVNPVPEASARPAESNRMALDNIRQRLALAYEEGARLRTNREGNEFRVELVLPSA